MNTDPILNKTAILGALDGMGIAYTLIEHQACASMEECESIVSPCGAKHCKNLFLVNKRGTEYYLLLLERSKRFVTSEISRLLGSTRLSFASDEKLMELLALSPGSVSAVGLLNDKNRLVHPVIDSDILRCEKMLIHPGVNTASLEVNTADVKAFIEKLGYELRIIDVK